jgi:hypothetical protein
LVNVSPFIFESSVGTGCSAVNNTVTPTILFTGPDGAAVSLNGPTLTISGNGTLDANNGAGGIVMIAAQANSTVNFQLNSVLNSTGCGTIPQYQSIVEGMS